MSLITTLLNCNVFFAATISFIIGCIAWLIVPNSTSPILAVPATVLKPSGAKNIKSPAISWIVCPSIQPTFFVTGTTATVLELFIFCSLNIEFWQKINNSLRKLFKPTTLSSKVILPEPVPLKLSMSFVAL